MTSPNIISFLPKFTEEDADQEAIIQEYRLWLETHGDYGRLFMWYIPRPGVGQEAAISGVRIYDSEVAMLFCIMFGLQNA